MVHRNVSTASSAASGDVAPHRDNPSATQQQQFSLRVPISHMRAMSPVHVEPSASKRLGVRSPNVRMATFRDSFISQTNSEQTQQSQSSSQSSQSSQSCSVTETQNADNDSENEESRKHCSDSKLNDKRLAHDMHSNFAMHGDDGSMQRARSLIRSQRGTIQQVRTKADLRRSSKRSRSDSSLKSHLRPPMTGDGQLSYQPKNAEQSKV